MGSILDIAVPVGLCILAIIAAAIAYSIVVAVKGRRASKRQETAWREYRSETGGRPRDGSVRR